MNKSKLFTKAHSLTKEIIKEGDVSEKTIAEKIFAAGGKLWEKHDMKRIYMTCSQFNEVTDRDYSLNDNNNKIFYDFAANAILRSYKGKKPNLEVQY